MVSVEPRTIFCVTVMRNGQRKDQAVPVSETALANYWSLYPCPVRPGGRLSREVEWELIGGWRKDKMGVEMGGTPSREGA